MKDEDACGPFKSVTYKFWCLYRWVCDKHPNAYIIKYDDKYGVMWTHAESKEVVVSCDNEVSLCRKV